MTVIQTFRNTLAATFLLAIGCAGCSVDTSSLDAPPSSSSASVARIIDGDTIRMVDGTTVRLVQIDTPEAPGKECGHDLATRELERLLPAGTQVTLQSDPALDERDRYDRLLRYVRVDDTLINERLIVAGVAAPYFYRGERGMHAVDLERAARHAKTKGRGAWAACPNAALDVDRAWTTSR